MYGTMALFLYRTIGSEGWSRQLYQNQQFNTLEQYLLYEYIKTDLYERQLKLGMLSPYADPFYPPTNNILREKDRTENPKEETEKIKLEEKEGDATIKDTNRKNIQHTTIPVQYKQSIQKQKKKKNRYG